MYDTSVWKMQERGIQILEVRLLQARHMLKLRKELQEGEQDREARHMQGLLDEYGKKEGIQEQADGLYIIGIARRTLAIYLWLSLPLIS